MDNANGHTMNLANSIIGVSILAMPYCFKQCGILLSVLILLISSIISRLACHFLLKSAIKARRKTFEFLAFHVFGTLGKFSVEISMIGFQLGTCVAFFVVMGDLGPAIISEMTGVVVGGALRNGTLIALAVFCVLPLGLLRNVDSLNGVSKATIGFYCCLVLKIVVEALPHIFTGDWVSQLVIWRPAGILQCLPIFSMALFCQTQLFEIYQAIPNASLEKMNSLIRVAVNICTWVYIFVGAFGYIAFFQQSFTGNILISFKPSITSDVIKMGFVLSLAFSFPLVIFPCRASLYSLLYKGSYTSLHESAPINYIPEFKFKMLTVLIVTVSLIMGIMIPNIELVLGLVGSTIGVMICVLFPVTCFICISPKNTNERILAQIMLFVGVIVMVLGTYANLYAFEEAKLYTVTEKIPHLPEINKPPMIQPEKPVVIDIPTTIKAVVIEEKKKKSPDEIKFEEKPKEIRHEPPQPEEPAETLKTTEEKKIEDKQRPAVEPVLPIEDKAAKQKPVVEQVEDKADKQMPVVEPLQPIEDKVDKQGPVVEPIQPVEDKVDEQKPVVELIQPVEDKIGKQGPVIELLQPLEKKKTEEIDVEAIKKEDIEVKKNEEVDVEAIKKEETELKEQEVKDSNQILIDTIQKHNEVQEEMVKQQKKLIEVIQQHQDLDKVNEEKVKAVKQIESIARKAIESISGQDGKLAVPKKEDHVEETGQKKIENIARKAIESISGQDAKLSAKKEDNIVETGQKNIESIARKAIDSINRQDAVKKIEKTAPRNVEMTQKTDQVEATNKTKIVDEVKQLKNESSNLKLVPLPIALAKANNVTVETKTINTTVLKDEQNDIKNLRRDILSDDETKSRAKREVNEEKIEKLNKAMKEVCDEMSRLTTTEKPLIKMLCKLSEPELVQADLGLEQNGKIQDVKPQKRDLKQFSEK